MSWAVFENTPDGLIHVAPCDDDSRPAGGHDLAVDCWCRPSVGDTGIVVHKHPHWPGADEMMSAAS